ncbi:MYND-type zinc finger-containing chromatin reader ZMYND8 [Dirofilaria immitis]
MHHAHFSVIHSRCIRHSSPSFSFLFLHNMNHVASIVCEKYKSKSNSIYQKTLWLIVHEQKASYFGEITICLLCKLNEKNEV